MSEEREKRYWVGFNLVKGIGAVRFRRMLQAFESLEKAWYAPSDALRRVGFGEKHLENFHLIRSQVDLDRYWEALHAKDIQVVTWMDENYPRLLKEIDQSPPVLYVRGELGVSDEIAVAVVGTRRVTRYGRQVAEEIAAGLAQSGVTVVSGLARGVDTIAHQAALDAGGRTIAVLGSGVDRIYPPEHRRLAERMTGHATRCNEFPAPQPHHFGFVSGCGGGRGRREEWGINYRRFCSRTRAGCLCCAGKYPCPSKCGNQSFDPKGCLSLYGCCRSFGDIEYPRQATTEFSQANSAS